MAKQDLQDLGFDVAADATSVQSPDNTTDKPTLSEERRRTGFVAGIRR